ncbi:MAG: hypothetical protein ABR506_02940 [Candidatus Krumholzibacteriia bacterium]
MVRASSRRAPAPPLATLPATVALLAAVLLGAAPAAADPDYRGPLLYGLDPVVRATEDPRLLGVERLVLLRRLEVLGVEPARDGGVRPTLATNFRRRFREQAAVDLERRETLLEYNDVLGLATRITYPKWLYLFPAAETLPGGILWYPPRRLFEPGVERFVDDLDLAVARAHAVVARTGRMDKLTVVGAGKRAQDDDGLINLTIPIKLPRTLEKIIGRGEKTRIRISGRERLAITGESTVVKPFTPNERVASQSLFPSLDMEQELQINLSGTIGEKIILEVDHNSAAIGPDATKIKLMYQGTEDEIIKTIETGDVGLTLPGSQLLGYSSNKSGLFGIKVTGQVGRADFTVVASKQKAESSSKTFNSKGGSVEPKILLSHQFINNRFFKLFNSRETAAIDPSWRVDRNSIQIFRRRASTGGAGADEINNVAVYVDPTGVWSDFVAGSEPYNKGFVWQRVEYEIMLDTDGRVYALDLGSGVADTDYLAITYRIVDAQGGLVAQVGDDPNLPGAVPSRSVPNDDQLYYAMKLLKAPPNPAEPVSHGYVVRNIYSLGGSDIDPTTFEFRIERTRADLNPQLDEQGVNYFEIFGLDLEDPRGGPPDGVVDWHRPELFDLQRGLLKFPVNVPEPFAPADPQAFYEGNVNQEGWSYQASAYLVENQVPQLYSPDTPPNLYPNYGKFQLVATHAAVSSSFSLGASNIEDGSEAVTLDGRTLTRGVDYEIDYLFGEITLKGEAANLTPDSQIGVSYQYSPFFGGGNTSLLGLNLGYDLGRESKAATTWLYQTEAIVGEKAKLGEEPSKTLVGNFNLQHTFRPGFLTTVANLLSRRNTERESSLQLSGEVAVSLPNPNTKGVAYLEDFEGVDASDMVPLTRTSWSWASAPVLGARWRFETGDSRVFTPQDRVEAVRWFLPKDRVPRRWLNPDLVNQERDETQQVMDLYLRADDGTWDDSDWGGIMRGISRTGLDLSKSQFVEIWVNDGERDRDLRSGRLHIDFGFVNEDGFWPDDGSGGLVVGQWEREDGINNTTPDGIYTPDEDIGLDGSGPDGDQRFSSEYVSDANPYPNINGTANNQRLDTEDLNGDDQLNRLDGFFTATIDLKDTPALVDVAYDYETLGDMPADQSWRKYRIALGQLDSVSVNTTANIRAVTHVRLWYENDTPLATPVKKLQFSELRFLGSRWEREGIRRVGDEALLGPADLVPGEEFFLGEVNNKENPDFAAGLPFAPRVEGNIPEKEQALVLDFENLDRGHLMRTSKQVSVRGDDYTTYDQMTWWWYNPSHRTADVDLFFRVGADTLNYYEVAYNFADDPNKVGWQQVVIDLKDLSNAKNAPFDDDGVRRALLRDARGGPSYRVSVVGRPDLRSVKRYYFGVANTRLDEPVSGSFYFNDVKLEGVKRDLGMAQRAGARLNMADVIKVDFDWSHRDPEFHGLDAAKGSGVDDTDWNLSTSFSVDDFIPLAGFRLPVNLSRRSLVQRPKYETNSDIEIIEQDVQNAMSTLEEREGFSTRLSHAPSKAALLRYLIDPWSFSLAGSRSWRVSPADERKQKALQGTANYDLRLPGRYTLGRYPLLSYLPVVRGLAFLPAKVALGGSFTSQQTGAVTIAEDGTVTPRPTTRTRDANLNAGVDYEPLTVLSASATVKSQRDMLRPEEVMGVNIGQENRRNYDLRLTFTPPRPADLGTAGLLRPVRTLARQINALRPSVQFTGAFADDHSPGLQQPGDPEGIRSLSNNGSWEFRLSVPVGDAVKKVFPERRYSEDERRRLIQQQQQHEQQAARRGQAETRVELTPEETEGLTPDQIRELTERRLLEAAEAAAEQERLEAGARNAAAGADADAEADAGGPGFSLGTLTNAVLTPLREVTPVKITWTEKKASTYARYTGDTPFWYKTGLLPEIDGADTLAVSYSSQERKTLNVAATTKLARTVSLDMKYANSTSRRDQSAAVSESYQQDWPDLQVSVSGMERWPLLGGGDGTPDSGWFRSSNLNLGFKRSRTVNNYTETNYNPTTGWNLSPRWTGTFHSGLTATLTVNRSADTQVNNSVITASSRTRVGLQVRHKFQAQSLLIKLGLYRPGSNPAIDMDVDVSWEADRTERTNPGGQAIEPTGTTRYSVNPRFSYQVTRNLSGALRFIFSRSGNIASGQSTTTLGLGLEATFVF